MEQAQEIHEQSLHQYNTDEYTLTPCRFAPSGWKYVKKRGSVAEGGGATGVNSYQAFLNHPNKRNSIGYYSSHQVGTTGPTTDHISVTNQQIENGESAVTAQSKG